MGYKWYSESYHNRGSGDLVSQFSPRGKGLVELLKNVAIVAFYNLDSVKYSSSYYCVPHLFVKFTTRMFKMTKKIATVYLEKVKLTVEQFSMVDKLFTLLVISNYNYIFKDYLYYSKQTGFKSFGYEMKHKTRT